MDDKKDWEVVSWTDNETLIAELVEESDRRLAWIRTMNDRRVSMGLSCISCNLRPKSNYKDGYVDRHTSNCELAKELADENS